jgi:hypothetical protein
MAAKSRHERLFGAACVHVTFERLGGNPSDHSLYRDTLEELGVSDDEVAQFLREHRAEVESKLNTHGSGSHGRR